MIGYAASPKLGCFKQGEIFSDVVEVRVIPESLNVDSDNVDVEFRTHPIAVLVTQDCDLDWDFKARNENDATQKAKLGNKLLPNLIFCEVWLADQLKGKQSIASDIWKRIRQNQDERYHYFSEIPSEADTLAKGFPALTVDFKRVFTVPPEELYKRLSLGTQRRTVLQGPFMQDLSNRFAYYHLRVALPT